MHDHSKFDLLRALRVFLAVADNGSMTAAASHLKITQSAISQQLKLLETEMRATLIDRHTRPLTLTPAGAALHGHALDIMQRARQARAEVHHISSGPMPHLRIAMFDTLANVLVPVLARTVTRRDMPIRTVSIYRGTAAQHVQDLPRRDVDVVITSNPLIDVEGLERHELIRENFILVLPKGAVPRQLGLHEIAARLPMIRYSARTETGKLIEQHLRRQRIDIPHGHSFDSPEDLLMMVGMGEGWSIAAPTHLVHAQVHVASLELRALPRPSLGRSIVLVARKDELGSLPGDIAELCRRTLARDYLPRVKRLMPKLADHFTVVDDRL